MRTLILRPPSHHIHIPGLRRVGAGHPLLWLRHGVRDFRRTWMYSLPLGIVFAAAGWFLVNWGLEWTHRAMALITGFMLVAPFLSIGFLALSSQSRGRQPPSLSSLGALLRRNGASIGLYAAFLAFVLSAWERLSAVLVALYLSDGFVANNYFSLGLLFSLDHLPFLLAYFGVGALLAAMVFALTAVSLPMLMDRPVDVVTAMATSFWAVRENLTPMFLWACIIVGLTSLGFVTGFIGLAITFPILGHATWHAYRELVAKE